MEYVYLAIFVLVLYLELTEGDSVNDRTWTKDGPGSYYYESQKALKESRKNY